MISSFWILLFWAFGLLAGAAAVVCALLLMTLRIAHGGGSSGQKKLFGATLILLALAIFVSLTYATAYVRARAELEAEIALVRERGEPVWFSELEPGPVDSALDATLLFQKAADELEWPPEEFDELIYKATQKPLETHWAYRQALSDNQEALALLAEALQRPHFQWPYDYNTRVTWGIELPHIDEMSRFNRLLRAEAICAIASGDGPRATAAIDQLLQMAEFLREEPFFVCQLVRIRYGGEALDLAELLIANHDLDADAAGELDARLVEIVDAISLRRTLISERAALLTLMDSLGSAEAAEDGRAFDVLGYADMGLDADWSNLLWGSWLYRPYLLRDQAFALSQFREINDGVEPLDAESLAFAKEFNDRFDKASQGFAVSSELFPNIFAYLVENALRYRQRLISARLALRVDRYRDEHGRLPESLNAVLDEDMTRVPRDLFKAKPLVYERNGGGFAIYPDGEEGEALEEDDSFGTKVRFTVNYDVEP